MIGDTLLWQILIKAIRLRESKDASGHEHRGKGPGGGQFTSGGSGGGGGATAEPQKKATPGPAPQKAAPAGPGAPPISARQAGDVVQAITLAGMLREVPGNPVGVGGGDGLAPVDVIHRKLAQKGVSLKPEQMRALVDHLERSGAVSLHLVNEQGRLTDEARALGVPKDPKDPHSAVLTLVSIRDPGKLRAALAALAPQ